MIYLKILDDKSLFLVLPVPEPVVGDSTGNYKSEGIKSGNQRHIEPFENACLEIMKSCIRITSLLTRVAGTSLCYGKPMKLIACIVASSWR